MRNISRLLDELVKQDLISPAVRSFLLYFFESRMRLKRDIKESDIASAVSKMAMAKFGTGLGLSDDYMTGDFKRWTPSLISEAGVVGAVSGNMSSSDLGKMFFVFCQVHDALEIGH